jgi:Flp pilus assembly protein TadG
MRPRTFNVAEIEPVSERPSVVDRLSGRAARLRRRWRRDERGAAAIEFAIIAPVFFFLMFVIAETALVFVAEQVLDNAVFETARLIRTGQVQQGGMSPADFKQEVCDRISVFIDCTGTNFYLEVKAYDTFADMIVNKPVDDDDNFTDPGTYDFGTASEIVVVRAYYQWPITPILGHQWQNAMANGKLLIGSFAAFCNEPYTTTTGGCGS